MAHRIALTTGNYSTTATWGTATNTPTIHASTNITNSTTGVFSGTFTAPSTTNASRGVIVWLNSKGTATSLTATLQEDAGAGFADTVATATITLANVSALSFIHFQWAAYTFTTTTANKYRVKMTANTASGNLAADSGGANFAYMHIDNRSSAAPAVGSSDQIWIVGNNNATPLVTVTIDGTGNTCGNGVNNSNITREWTNSVNIASGAIIDYPTASTATLTITGSTCIYPGGIRKMQPASTSVIHSWLYQPAATGQLEDRTQDGGSNILQGSPQTSTSLWKTTYVSGTGTAASPLVVADAVDWKVGDEIYVFATDNGATNYNNCEKRFIITKNSTTSYVLSNTSGGAENALTATHSTSARVVNITRNVIIGSAHATNNAANVFFTAQTGSTTSTLSWVRFTKCASVSGSSCIINAGTSVDYSVVDVHDRVGFRYPNTATAQTFTGNISCAGTSVPVSQNGAHTFVSGTKNKTIVDCFAINSNGAGFGLATCTALTFVRCIANGLKGSTSANGFTISLSQLLTFTDCEVNAVRGKGTDLQGVTGSRFITCSFGNKGNNLTGDIQAATDSYNIVVFDRLTASSTNFILNYLLMVPGSEVKFHTLQGTTNNHVWYTPFGIARSTGAGLTDTTVRTAGSLGIRLAPEDATDGFTWQFYIPAKANSIVNFSGYALKNSTFGSSVARIELWLPGATAASATQTLNNTTGATYAAGQQAILLQASNTATTDGLATIKVIAITATSGAYLYMDDFYNAGDTITNFDKVTGLDTWFDGKPIEVISPQVTSAADFLGTLLAGYTTAGTVGRKLNDLGTTADIADAVWDEPKSGHATTGTFGEQVGKKISTKAVPEY